MTLQTNLTGRVLLVVEDDFLIGSDFVKSLEELGADVLGPIGNIDEALDLIVETTELDAVVLDLNLGGEMSYQIADELVARGIPFVFTTGYDRSQIAPRFSEVARCEKPVDVSQLARALFKEQ